jgi:alkanesulfonate monooxygenase SsuD/methylene tetrahydromethanopterin reductase-like flavin-dependent oxidoreductase (luciferase family)
VQDPIPVWVAVGGSPPSVIRAATLGLPMALAIIGGAPERFRSVVELYRETAARAGHDPETLPVSINSHGFVASDAESAADTAFPPFAETMTRIGRERGWPPTTRRNFEAERTRHGALFVGSPEQVVEKILFQHEIFHHQRFLIQLTVGPMPHADVMRAIELLGTEVAPAVRKELGVERKKDISAAP